jgi:hypothetical protein
MMMEVMVGIPFRSAAAGIGIAYYRSNQAFGELFWFGLGGADSGKTKKVCVRVASFLYNIPNRIIIRLDINIEGHRGHSKSRQ